MSARNFRTALRLLVAARTSMHEASKTAPAPLSEVARLRYDQISPLIHALARDVRQAEREAPQSAPAWTLTTRHTPECVEHLTDPGARCICRPPAAVEPRNPTPAEVEHAKRGDK